ncbi:MAG: hypothetical protein BGO01_07275 [Armatimonadetes bacterium 55-13]|nr:hypothetical protein [Armatimonadota bacterium]OJU62297.1 MAG: hypothetical protein BGO01_07275 [Armatimonadetes bacterium 55-13]
MGQYVRLCMRGLFLVACVFVLGSAQADEIKIQNLRPSRLLSMLVDGKPMSSGNKLTETHGPVTIFDIPLKSVKADDIHSTLIVEGIPESIKALRDVVALFDVQPRTIKAEFQLVVPLEKYDSKSSAVLRNNSTWKLDDSTARIKVAVTPRLNEDGTITVFIKADGDGESYSMVVRLKQGQETEIALDGLNEKIVREVPIGKEKNPSLPYLKLRVSADDLVVKN